MKSMPSISSISPNVSRTVPTMGSVPTRATMRPKTAIRRAFTADPLPRLAVIVRPRVARRKNSGALNFSAKPPRIGQRKASSNTAPSPAINEPIAATERAAPARPCLAS